MQKQSTSYPIIFFLVMFVVGTDTFLISPLLPTLIKFYGISTATSGLLVSAYALGYTLSALVAGPISDSHDRRKILLTGLLCFAGATFFCGLANTFWIMMLARLLAGISAAFIGPQVWGSIPLIVPQEKIVAAMGLAAAGLAVSQIIGIPLGSYLAIVSWRFPFFFIAFLALLLLGLCHVSLPSLNQANATPQLKFTAVYQELWYNQQARLSLLAYFIFQLGNFCSLSFIGTWFNKNFQLSVGQIGTAMILIGCGNLIGTLLNSKLVSFWGVKRTFFGGLIVYILLYTLVATSKTLFVAQILLTLIFVVGGIIFPLFMTNLQATITTARSTISSVSNAAMFLGEALGGFAGGILIANFPGFWGIGIFTALLASISYLLYALTLHFW